MLLLGALTALAAIRFAVGMSTSTCNVSVSVSYVTLSPSTVYVPVVAGSLVTRSSLAPASTSQLLEPAVSSPSGIYYFSISDGTTLWLNGEAPPTSLYDTFVTQTLTLTVSPAPEASLNASSQLAPIPAISTSHASSTTQLAASTGPCTNTSTAAVPTGPVFTGTGNHGWNSTTAGATAPSGTSGTRPGTAYSSLKSNSTLRTIASMSRPSYTGARLTTMTFNPTKSSSSPAVWSEVSARHSATTASGASPSTTPEHCGEWGNFTLNWDDEPVFTPPDNSSAWNFPPVFNPYHHLFFSNGYAYVPQKQQPFEPVSLPHLAIFFANLTGDDRGSPFAGPGGVKPGEIGAGPRAPLDQYWFDAYDAYVGCDNKGPGDCMMRISGYVWDEQKQSEALAVRQNVTIPPCAQFLDCELTPIEFSDKFRALAGIQFEAFVEGSNTDIFFLDNLNLGWYNNTCAAGLLRIRQRRK